MQAAFTPEAIDALFGKGRSTMSNHLLYAVSYESAGLFNDYDEPRKGDKITVDDLVIEVVQVERIEDDWDSTEFKVILRATEGGGDPVFFLKTGYQDSYGDRKWQGGLSQVEPTTETVTVYKLA